MRDPRHKAAVIRIHDELRSAGVRLHNDVIDRIAGAALRDDTEHDVTRYGRHLEDATRKAAAGA